MQTYRSKLRCALRTAGCEAREDMSGCRRRVQLEVFPRNTTEVRATLQIAHRHGVKIHPVSCGRNWGFGSSLPVAQDCLLLNLSTMNRIRQLREGQHVVEVEPGVTQGQLADYLEAHGDTHFLNVTGAGLSTSVLGNALERGIGYFGSRDRDLMGAEILLSGGELIQLGYGGRFSSGGAPVGPDLGGLFVQSGWGIVTAGTFSLQRKSKLMGGVLLEVEDPSGLPSLVRNLGSFMAEGWVQGVPHIFNQARLETTFGGTRAWPSWVAVVPVRGPKMLVKAVVDELRHQLSPHVAIKTLKLDCPDEETGPLDAISPLLGGKPIDLALFSMAKTIATTEVQPHGAAFDPEAGTAGLLHVTPSCALNDLSRLLDVVKKSAAAHGWGKLPLSFNLVSQHYGCLVVSICFKRASTIQKTSARNFANDLLRECTSAGFRPYRLGLEQVNELEPFGPALAKLCRRVRDAVDPDLLLAPSRYGALWDGDQTERTEGRSSLVDMIERQQLRTSRSLCVKNVVSS
jgi:4-cresol dehydrogenase (hydroxylating)